MPAKLTIKDCIKIAKTKSKECLSEKYPGTRSNCGNTNSDTNSRKSYKLSGS